MIQILEYIAQNYTLFLSVLVLILLAIIGYYADKTNFGQGKNQEKESKEVNDNKEEQKTLNEAIKTNDSSNEEKLVENVDKIEIAEEKNENAEEKNENAEENKLKEALVENTINEINSEESIIKKEEQIKEFDEIESLLPKKELINSDLLNEIEGMEFNSIKEKTSFDVPDLDDISLPKIKNLVEKEQDIWKF